MSKLMEKLELLLKLGGMKEDITFLVISGTAVKMEEKRPSEKYLVQLQHFAQRVYSVVYAVRAGTEGFSGCYAL